MKRSGFKWACVHNVYILVIDTSNFMKQVLNDMRFHVSNLYISMESFSDMRIVLYYILIRAMYVIVYCRYSL